MERHRCGAGRNSDLACDQDVNAAAAASAKGIAIFNL
jgi:hypothetical protein